MITDTVHPVTTDAPTDERLTGDYYDDTADESLAEVAQRLYRDLRAVQGDDMLPAIAEFDVTVDATTVGILRMRISGLIDMVDPCVIYEAMRVQQSCLVWRAITTASTSPDLTRRGLSNM